MAWVYERQKATSRAGDLIKKFKFRWMAQKVQEEIISNLKESHEIKCEFEAQVLEQLKKTKLWN